MSEEDLTLATLCVKILKTHPFTEKYMGDEDPFNPKIEKVNQLNSHLHIMGILLDVCLIEL